MLNLDGGFDLKKEQKVYIQPKHDTKYSREQEQSQKNKLGRKRLLGQAVHKLRQPVERTFAWEDKFKEMMAGNQQFR
jgi:hypothetical protein